MSNTQDIFQQVQLTEASYADFSTGVAIEDALETSGFSEAQAAEFIEHWQVVNHMPNTDDNGFSATLFQSLDAPGQYTLAIRGTEFPADIINDILSADLGGIAISGAAFEQIIDLYNYWQRLTTPAEQNVRIAKLATTVDATASGIFTHKTIIDAAGNATVLYGRIVFEETEETGMGLNLNNLNVTGHSLGGHLAVAFMRLFGNDIGASAYTVNGAGFYNTVEINRFFNALAEHTTQFSDTNIIRIQAEAGLDAISDNPLHTYYGTFTPTFIESPFKGTLGHGVGQLTDSAAVYDLFIRLDPALQTGAPSAVISTLTHILDASSNEVGRTLEEIVNAFSDIFHTGFPRITEEETDDREALFARISALQNAIDGLPPVSVISLIGKSVAELKVKAEGLVELENALAYRYALVNLNPFVITGNDELYSPHNLNKELDLYNADTNPDGQLTELYLHDRARFLELKIQLALEDKAAVEDVRAFEVYRDLTTGLEITDDDATEFSKQHNPNYIFGRNEADIFQGYAANDHLFGGGGNDVIWGDKGDDIIEGNSGDDDLRGGKGHDVLLGGSGDDILYGGAPDSSLGSHIEDNTQDVLIGGSGHDTYYIGHGDILIDSDGQGTIYKDGRTIDISNITRTTAGGTIYTNNNQDNLLRFTLLPDGTLQVIGSYFEIRNFTDGDFGISLKDEVVLPDDLTLITGTEGADSLSPDTPGNFKIQALGGNDTATGGERDDPPPYLFNKNLRMAA